MSKSPKEKSQCCFLRFCIQQVPSDILGLDGITSIVVTHSLEESLLRQYDGVIALKNGSIAESGSFDALIAKKGYFYSLFTISQ